MRSELSPSMLGGFPPINSNKEPLPDYENPDGQDYEHYDPTTGLYPWEEQNAEAMTAPAEQETPATI